jgi:hypothetical protein
MANPPETKTPVRSAPTGAAAFSPSSPAVAKALSNSPTLQEVLSTARSSPDIIDALTRTKDAPAGKLPEDDIEILQGLFGQLTASDTRVLAKLSTSLLGEKEDPRSLQHIVDGTENRHTSLKRLAKLLVLHFAPDLSGPLAVADLDDIEEPVSASRTPQRRPSPPDFAAMPANDLHALCFPSLGVGVLEKEQLHTLRSDVRSLIENFIPYGATNKKNGSKFDPELNGFNFPETLCDFASKDLWSSVHIDVRFIPPFQNDQAKDTAMAALARFLNKMMRGTLTPPGPNFGSRHNIRPIAVAAAGDKSYEYWLCESFDIAQFITCIRGASNLRNRAYDIFLCVSVFNGHSHRYYVFYLNW